MNKVTERAIEYMIRPIESYTGNGLLEQVRRVDEFQLSLFFCKIFLLYGCGKGKVEGETPLSLASKLTTPHILNLVFIFRKIQ